MMHCTNVPFHEDNWVSQNSEFLHSGVVSTLCGKFKSHC